MIKLLIVLSVLLAIAKGTGLLAIGWLYVLIPAGVVAAIVLLYVLILGAVFAGAYMTGSSA